MSTRGPAAELVLRWGLPRLRDLPWRNTRDPWGVLVSEVMLQQTQVARVLTRWPQFLERFPTPAACAAAPLADVLREWQGLGYPRRARNLHAAASMVTAAGAFPNDLAGLLALPGVGPYTARAVLAFAYEADVAVVDTNIARIYARLAGRPLRAAEVQAHADAHVPRGSGWAWNQCLMDLGALVCRPTPDCAACPLASVCSWRGRPDLPDPAVGSAGVSSTQPRFAGSDREARGRLLRALTAGAVRRTDAATVMGRDPATAERLIVTLTADRLVEASAAWLWLPGEPQPR